MGALQGNLVLRSYLAADTSGQGPRGRAVSRLMKMLLTRPLFTNKANTVRLKSVSESDMPLLLHPRPLFSSTVRIPPPTPPIFNPRHHGSVHHVHHLFPRSARLQGQGQGPPEPEWSLSSRSSDTSTIQTQSGSQSLRLMPPSPLQMRQQPALLQLPAQRRAL